MLTVLIEARDGNAEALATTFGSLISASVEGVVREVVILDAGMGPAEREIAHHAGCTIRPAAEIADAIAASRGAWLLVLEAGAEMMPGWTDVVTRHVRLGEARIGARFRPARWKMWDVLSPSRGRRLSRGLLAPRALLNERYRIGMPLRELVGAVPSKPLLASIVPASRR